MSDRFAYDLGVYVQKMRQEEARISQLLRENNPWPANVSPNGDWHQGVRSHMLDVIRDLEWIIPKDTP